MLIDTEGLTIEDLDELSGTDESMDGRRYELLGGSIVVNAAPVVAGAVGGGVGLSVDGIVGPGGQARLEASAPIAVSVPLAELFAPPG